MANIHDRPGAWDVLADMAAEQLSDVHEMLRAWAKQNGHGEALSLALRARELVEAMRFTQGEEPKYLNDFFRTVRGDLPDDEDCALVDRRAAEREASRSDAVPLALYVALRSHVEALHRLIGQRARAHGQGSSAETVSLAKALFPMTEEIDELSANLGGALWKSEVAVDPICPDATGRAA